MSDKQEKLQGECLLGYVDFSKSLNTYEGSWSHVTPVEKKEKNIPSQYYQSKDFSSSSNLSRVRQSNGGYLPKVNTGIGAPKCTFIEGGIVPGLASPFAKYIIGPPKSNLYNPVFGEGGLEMGDTLVSSVSSADNVSDFKDGINLADTPTIPVNGLGSQYNKTGVTIPSLNTYNIWRLYNLNMPGKNPGGSDTYKLVKNRGYVFNDNNTSSYNGPWMYQHFNNDTVYACVVAPEGHPAFVGRIFPTSSDTLYETGCTLYYPNPPENSGKQPQSPRVLKTKKPELNPNLELNASRGNCGFHMHLLHDEINEHTSLSNNALIMIHFRSSDEKLAEANSMHVNDFLLYIFPNEPPRLYYKDPCQKKNTNQKDKYKVIQLNGPTLRDQRTINVYVHFAGSVMLIGFEEDPAEWNVFAPIEDIYNENQYYYPYLDAGAKVSMMISNMTLHFQYSPIAFNNFNLDHDYTAQDNGDPNDNYYSRLKTEMTVDNTGTDLNYILQKNAYLNNSITTITDKEHVSPPTYYADWRSNDYQKQLSFSQITMLNQTVFNNKTGQYDFNQSVKEYFIEWQTSIEGPVFLQIADTPDKTQKPAPTIIENIKDLSPYLSGWKVKYSGIGKLRGFIQGTATVILKDLILSEEGPDILNTLEENTMLITLSAGYGESKRYFQGIIKNSVTEYNSTGSTTTLTCLDLAHTVLTQTKIRGVYVFTFSRFMDVLRICCEIVGFPKDTGYFITENPFSSSSDAKSVEKNAFWNETLKFRIGAGLQLYSSVISDYLSVQPLGKGVLEDAIMPVLDSMWNKSLMPTMYWDYKDHRIVITVRQSQVDEIYFYGSFINDKLPDTRDRVIVDNYSITTDNDTLYSGSLFYAIGILRPIIMTQPDTFESVEPTDITNVQPKIGWVGFNKIWVEDLSPSFIQTQTQLKAQADIRKTNRLQVVHSKISFKLHITQPLNHWASFIITTFSQKTTNNATNPYGYTNVTYDYDKENNLLTADVEGENFPRSFA